MKHALVTTLAACLVSGLFAAPALAESGREAASKAPVVNLDTSHGRIVIRLRPDLAPKHAERIETLTKRGFYNGVPFHRVIEGFMAQTGDPTGTGAGGSDLPDLPAEFSQESFRRGAVGMARAASPNSANSQFFIMYGRAPHLDGKYTLVGEVISGMDVADRIRKGDPARNGLVENPDRIVKMEMAPAGQ
ncbi:peptidylprolyl isomerase [Camelimonas abortus]|uniref:Peptidyl-prolyl cis-trans isomerase n=1 Tax=Camelimonas abortus TaxID=1017184 RepID=A0ABV7LD62_9HYPH